MKLLDDDKKREENNDETIEKNKLQCNNTSSDIDCVMKITTEAKVGKNIVKNGITLNKKNSPDDSKSEKSIEKESGKDDREINVNINAAKDQKHIRKLTEEFKMLRFDGKDHANVGRKESDMKEDDPKSSDKISNGDNRSNTDSVDDITASVKAIVLDSELKDTAKQVNNGHVVLIAEKCEIPRTETDCAKIKEEYVPRWSSKEKDGEENEDSENTHLISDANCISLHSRGPENGVPRYNETQDSDNYAQPSKYSRPFMELVSHGPGGGVPKYNGTRDSDNYVQPSKYSRPFRELGSCNPHMSGGSVQVVPLNIQSPVFDLNTFGGLNAHSTNLPYDRTIHPSFVPPMDDVNLAHGYPFTFSPEFSQLDWATNQQSAAFCDSGSGYSFLRDMIGNCDGLSLSQQTFDLGLDGCDPLSPTSLLIDSQFSTRSPHDQVLSSPGSSPPSHIYSPYSVSSVSTKDCDTTVMSPESCSMPSPDGGIVADLTEEENLKVVMDYIEEQEAMAGKMPPIPKLVEAFNTVHDPISSTLLPVSDRTGNTMVTSTGRPGNRGERRPTSKAKKTRPTTKILPPVADGGSMSSGGVILSPGVNFSLSTDFHVPCVLVDSTQSIRKQMPIRPRTIQPKPTADIFTSSAVQTSQPNLQMNTRTFVPPVNTPSPPQEPTVTSSSELDRSVKVYRLVAGIPKEKLLVQDEDGDSILHLMMVREETKFVKALLERYVREGLIDKVINLANKHHQTPLCLAVFLNQTDIVKMLIEYQADVNVQPQRKLNGGLKCYRLLHYAAKRGQKWLSTLNQLLSAKNIDLHAFDSDGCTAMHCAIKDHGETNQGSEKIDSKTTIFQLAMRGADMNHQHGLSGKTPLHCAIEKKDSDLVGWFLGLATYIQSNSRNCGSENMVHSIVNMKPSGGIAALQLALNIQMDHEEREKILELLLRHGAEVPQKSSDGKIRQELAKYPKLAPFLKNGTSASKNVQ